MVSINVRLFGRLAVEIGDRQLPLNIGLKAQELLAFLLLHPGRPHSRDGLVTILWEGETAGQGRKQLRQVLWLLQRTLKETFAGEAEEILPRLLLIGSDAIGLDLSEGVQLDTRELEAAFAAVRGTPGRELTGEHLHRLDRAAAVEGDLLEGWWCDWVIAPREYYRTIALASLEKLLAAHETRGDLDAAITCAARLFLIEPAHEPAHRALMRLYHGAGNRAAALRQFERCRLALARGFEVDPDRETIVLMTAIRAGDQVVALNPPAIENDLALRLDRLRVALLAIHGQLQSDLIALDSARARNV